MLRIASSLLFLGIVFSVSHFFFEPTFLYYEIWWLDIPMHILGGMGVASLTYAVLSYKGIHVSYMRLLFIFLIVAFLWELYEYLREVNLYETMSDYLDSVKDIVDGIIGMTVAYFFIRKSN